MPNMTKDVLFEITNRTVYPFDDEYVDIVVEADNNSRRINFSVCKYFDGVDLSTKNISVRFNNALQQYDEYVVKDMKVEDDTITFSWLISNKVVIQSGEAMFDVLFWDEDGYKWHTKPAKLKVEHGLLESDAIASQEAFDVYDQWRIEAKKNLEATTEAKDAAKVSETNAKESATNAGQSEANALAFENAAKTSETNAANSATNAGQSEANALASETNAANSATLAKSWAVGGTGTRTNEDFDNAKYYAQQAQVAAKGALGYYPTPERLREEHPTSSVGYWAIVGSTDSIWVWSETKNDWSDATYLTNYYTRTETNEITSKIAPLYTATYTVDGWTDASEDEKANGYMFKQVVTLTKDVASSPDVTADSTFMTVGACESSGVLATDQTLLEALGIINAGFTTSGTNNVTTLVEKKPASDISVKWAIKG